MKETTLIRDVRIVNEGRTTPGALLIEGERIARILHEGEELPKADHIVEGKGRLCLPGVIDDQVHFRDPGLTHKGDIASESSAALLGGVTSWMEMPNTNPQTTTLEAWSDKMKHAEEVARGNYAFYFGATNDNADLLPHLDIEHTPGVKVFMGASTGNMLVDDEEALRRIFGTSPVLVAVHSEKEEIIRANKAKYQARYGEDPPVQYHPLIRSREACYESTVRAIRLAKETGAKLHVLHLSTAEEVELFAGQSSDLRQKQYTAEVCVHHLWYDDQDYDRLGTRIKWNPAVKSAEDREALREGLRAGILDIIATDHAPHLLSEKEGGALKAASGGPLAQFSLVMMLELCRRGVFEQEQVVRWMCHRPAELFGVRERGYLREGYRADIVLVDDDCEWIVTPELIRSKCGWSPLEGECFHSRVTDVFLNGAHVVREGTADEDRAITAAEALEFDHNV